MGSRALWVLRKNVALHHRWHKGSTPQLEEGIEEMAEEVVVPVKKKTGSPKKKEKSTLPAKDHTATKTTAAGDDEDYFERTYDDESGVVGGADAGTSRGRTETSKHALTISSDRKGKKEENGSDWKDWTRN